MENTKDIQSLVLFDWNKPAEQIATEFRAVDFGPIFNSIQSLKMVVGDKVYLPTQLEVTDNSGVGVPGTILDIDSAGLIVKTSKGSLRLTGIKTVYGELISVTEIFGKAGIGKGDTLPSVPDEVLENLAKLERKSIQGEDFWRGRLSKLFPISFAKTTAIVTETERSYVTLPLDFNLIQSIDYSTDDFITTLLASWGAFISRITGEETFDLELNRTNELKRGTLESSLFSNCTPIRIELENGQSIVALSRSIKDELDRSRALPLYSTDLCARDPLIAKKKWVRARNKLPLGVAIADDEGDCSDDFSFHASIRVRAKGEIEFVYDRSAIDEAYGRCLKTAFEYFLQTSFDAPALEVSGIPYLSPEDAEAIKELGRGKMSDCSSLLPIHKLIEEVAAKTPEAVAVEDGVNRLSYNALNEKANQLAYLLLEKGVGPDLTVGIFLNRSVETILSILAVLKAGGAYVPLDPLYSGGTIGGDDPGCSPLVGGHKIR